MSKRLSVSPSTVELSSENHGAVTPLHESLQLGLAEPPKLCGYGSSDDAVVMGILQDIAEKTVKQAIAKHQECGGKKVTAARIRILPGSLRMGDAGQHEASVRQLTQEFVVRQQPDRRGRESCILEPIVKASEDACSFSPLQIDETPACSAAAHSTRSSIAPASLSLLYGSGTSTPISYSQASGTLRPVAPYSTTRLISGDNCTCNCPHEAYKPTHLHSPSSDAHYFSPCCNLYGSLPAASPCWMDKPLPCAMPPVGPDAEQLTDCCMEGFTSRSKLKNLAPEAKSLFRDIFKLWTMNLHYEEAARAVKAWMARHRCSHGREASEEQALKEIPHQYEKYRNLERALERLQHQVSPRLSSLGLRPLQSLLAANTIEEHSNQATDRLRRPQFVGFRHLTNQVARLNKVYSHLQQLSMILHSVDQCASDRPANNSTAVEGRNKSNALLLKITATLELQNQKLIKEIQQLSEMVTAQQALIRDLSEANQRHISEIVRVKGRHRVFCRILPGVDSPADSYSSVTSKPSYVTSQGVTTLHLKSCPASKRQTKSRLTLAHPQVSSFEFDRVYDEHCSTSDIYKDMKELTAAVLSGNALTIIVVGPPMSGKATTLFFRPAKAWNDEGAEKNSGEAGLVVQYLLHFYELLRKRCNMAPQKGSVKATLSCTCVEVYNETLLDAFEPLPAKGRERPEVVKNARTGEVRVTNLRRVGGEVTADTVETAPEQSTMVDEIIAELRGAMERRNAAGRKSHVIFTAAFEVLDHTLGKQQTGKMAFGLVAASANPALKPPFDATPTTYEVPQIGHLQDAVASIHLTNHAINSLRTILQARKSSRGWELDEEIFRGSTFTRILEDGLKRPALSVVLMTVPIRPDPKSDMQQ
ncbi:kinesin-1-like isoform x4 [Cyclospora cayetanensis]|uniref:Kinesin-1-like isoform x4 n=1 Tax=Cyclospora cayetanensis TaxID=88456 RepID=A0A1D3D1K8_9EIME|nr:kinesin-1-like isoform x4 [Cyclospora cayetanensis]